MFQNLSFTNFTWRREPVLYLALLVAIGEVVVQIIGGDLDTGDGFEALFTLVVGFFARSQVSPVES